jgi:hypothetical protein
MKIYAIFPNQKSGLIEEQLIETENYTQDELRDIAFYDIFLNNREREINADTLFDYRFKIGLDISYYAENKYTNIIPEDDLDEIVDSVVQELTGTLKALFIGIPVSVL